MRFGQVFVVAALLLQGCVSAPNALRVSSPLDGAWTALATSKNCGIAERFNVRLSGRAFGERIPGTDILLSGVQRGLGRPSSPARRGSLLGKGAGSPEVVPLDLDFETARLARGNWRSSRCDGTLVLIRGAVG